MISSILAEVISSHAAHPGPDSDESIGCHLSRLPLPTLLTSPIYSFFSFMLHCIQLFFSPCCCHPLSTQLLPPASLFWFWLLTCFPSAMVSFPSGNLVALLSCFSFSVGSWSLRSSLSLAPRTFIEARGQLWCHWIGLWERPYRHFLNESLLLSLRENLT